MEKKQKTHITLNIFSVHVICIENAIIMQKKDYNLVNTAVVVAGLQTFIQPISFIPLKFSNCETSSENYVEE